MESVTSVSRSFFQTNGLVSNWWARHQKTGVLLTSEDWRVWAPLALPSSWTTLGVQMDGYRNISAFKWTFFKLFVPDVRHFICRALKLNSLRKIECCRCFIIIDILPAVIFHCIIVEWRTRAWWKIFIKGLWNIWRSQFEPTVVFLCNIQPLDETIAIFIPLHLAQYCFEWHQRQIKICLSPLAKYQTELYAHWNRLCHSTPDMAYSLWLLDGASNRRTRHLSSHG